MSDTSPRLDLPYLQASQAQKHVTHNEALKRLDTLTQLAVAAFGAETPPAAPVAGDVHALGAVPTGVWAGQAGQLAAWDGTAWAFVAPGPGWRAWGIAEAELRVFDGAGWVAAEGDHQNLAGLGIGTAWDPVNRLALASDASLFNHDGANHHLKINKATTGDTASLLFQDGFSGRAEVGLTGDDNLTVKVSADGSSWIDAAIVDKDSGEVAFPEGLRVGASGSLMDVFEQGSWTPEVADAGSGGTTAVIGTAAGSYVRVGNLVHCWVNLDSIDASALTGANWVYLRGLPFACGPLKRHRGIFQPQLKFVALAGAVSGACVQGTSYIVFGEMGSNVALNIMTCADLQAGAAIQGQFSYLVG